MASWNSILCCNKNQSFILFMLMLISLLCGSCYSVNEAQGLYNSYTLSSFRYPQTKVKPYELRYIRVDLQPWFSSLSISVESDVDLHTKSLSKVPKTTLPIICFRDGSPPLPDVLNTSVIESGPIPSGGPFEQIGDSQNVHCYPLQKNLTLKLTNEQVSPGVYYLGFFNGIGPTRTQGKMIVRTQPYTFSANVTVDGCSTPAVGGQYCNQTFEPLFCSQTDSNGNTLNVNFQPNEVVVSCKSVEGCNGEGDLKVYSMDVVELAEQLVITAINVSLNKAQLDGTDNGSKMNLTCFARHGAIPSMALYDYAGDISKAPLIINSPKIGRWFFTISPANLSEEQDATYSSAHVCYSLKLQVLQCPLGRAGFNCSSNRYILQTVLSRESSPFESYFLPITENLTAASANFPLEPLSSNISYGTAQNWTYFLLNIPHGAAGGNIHIRLTSDAKINYETYIRFGGLPSVENWDYYYANKTRSSDGSIFFMLSNTSETKVDFYILYAKEGTWGFGLKSLDTNFNSQNHQTVMSVSVERCPKRCSSHGECKAALDASGLTSFSFCSCDRTHGGFDCSVEIVSHRGHIKQSIALIASNAAALFPAYWALRQKAFAEWVLFTSSGISSGLYHACDVGAWCALSFNVLQFMDFWLSFMAVVSTFVYMTTINESSKRTIHTVVAILTALMAITKATRSSNIVLVVAIGASGLFIGWLIEFSTSFRSFSFSAEIFLNALASWQSTREWLKNLVKILLKRFRWGFVLAGLTALTMAAISWNLESSESYWIWHSMWHISIYTSSFFFLCSKVKTVNSDNQPEGNYALARQDSFSRGEEIRRD